ncbi:MAG: MrtC family glutamic-type intramembrane protease [Polyangiaceae bacterium]|nr:MrtC family glutamic-type intramembrane protease [Polyangiaceae bacterium]
MTPLPPAPPPAPPGPTPSPGPTGSAALPASAGSPGSAASAGPAGPPGDPHRPGAGGLERAREPLVAAAAATVVVTALSWLLPKEYAATGVGLAFLAATWWLVWRRPERQAAAYGLGFGDLFEPTPLQPKRLVWAFGRAFGWALAAMLVVFPLFIVAYVFYRDVSGPPRLALPPGFADEVLGQLLVIALPEEAFFRGYLQTALDRVWPPHRRLFGAPIGPALVVSSAIFAVGHLLTDPRPSRLAVFFPSLLFGWLRAKTGDTLPGVFFHAACNLLVRSLGFWFGASR